MSEGEREGGREEGYFIAYHLLVLPEEQIQIDLVGACRLPST